MLEPKLTVRDFFTSLERAAGNAAPAAPPAPGDLARVVGDRHGENASRRAAWVLAEELPDAALDAALPGLDAAIRDRFLRAAGRHVVVRPGPGGRGASITARGAAGTALLLALPESALARVTDLELEELDAASLPEAVKLAKKEGLGAIERLEIAADGDASPLACALLPRLGRLAILSYRARMKSADGFAAIGAVKTLRALRLTAEPGAAGLEAITGLADLEEIDLFGFPMKPREIGALAALGKLRALRIASADLPKTAMKEILKLAALEELDLSKSDRLGDEALAQIGKLARLKRLVLSGTGAGNEAAKAIATLPALEELALDGNEKIGDAAARALAGCKSLRRLDVGFSGLKAKGLEALGALAKLTALTVTGTTSKGGLAAALPGLCALVHLVADGCVASAADLEAMAALPGLVELQVGSNKIGPKGAEALASLGVAALGIEQNPLGDAGMRALSRLPALGWLNVTECGVGPAGLADVGHLAGLTFLHGGNNPIGAGVKHLAALHRLRELYMQESKLGDDAGPALAKLGDLRELVVYDNSIGDAGAAHFAGLTKLRLLSLQGNPVTPAGVAKLVEALPDALVES